MQLKIDQIVSEGASLRQNLKKNDQNVLEKTF
jgi:hypothetical protein